MGVERYIGYYIDDFGEGHPIAVGDDRADAIGNAAVRVLTLGLFDGQVGSQKADLTDEEFASLKTIQDDWFAKAQLGRESNQ